MNLLHFQWYYLKLKILPRQKLFIKNFSTPRVLKQLTVSRSAQNVISNRVGVRSKNDGNQFSADLIASNCTYYFINFSQKKPIVRSIARAQGNVGAFFRRKAVNFSSCHSALKRTRGAISPIYQINYRRTSVRARERVDNAAG